MTFRSERRPLVRAQHGPVRLMPPAIRPERGSDDRVDIRHWGSDLALIDAYWRAANYLSVGQIYLLDNPLLREPLRAEHVKPRLLGHWGTTPGLNLVYAHPNRVIKARDLDAIYIIGPGPRRAGDRRQRLSRGHLRRGLSGRLTRDEAGLRHLFRQFSFPGGIGSHVTPETPGLDPRGRRAGLRARPRVRRGVRQPGLVVFCVVGDGEAETGPLAASWHSNKFLNPAIDGAVVPILHLNGYKIANPTVLARIPRRRADRALRGLRLRAPVRRAATTRAVHAALADDAGRGRSTTSAASRRGPGRDHASGRRWPMIVLRTPKGWTGPKVVDGQPAEGSFRSHQVPFADVRTTRPPGAARGLAAELPAGRAVRR